MDKPAPWVGVNYRKEELVVAVWPSGEQFSLANEGRELHSLVNRLAPFNCARIVFEATGGYETLLVADPQRPSNILLAGGGNGARDNPAD
jgi:hypothetical protein